jgi:FkbM family methyltransferase
VIAAEHLAGLASSLPEPIVVIDIGCRWGFADSWSRLGAASRIFGFDPDADECHRLAERYKGQPGIELIPVALGAAPGSGTLHITKNPGCSSVFPPATDAVEEHPALDIERVVRTEEIELTTLDLWAAERGLTEADFVKLDTQGSELAILRGGARLLGSVQVVEVEVEFNALYDGAALFGDIDRFLREHGFVLWRLKNLAHYPFHGVQASVRVAEAHWFDFGSDRIEGSQFEARLGQLYFADAFFVRDSLARPRGDRGWSSLVRNACLAAAVEFHDLAALSLACAHATAPQPVAALIDRVLRNDYATVLDLAALRGRIDGTHGPGAPVVPSNP